MLVGSSMVLSISIALCWTLLGDATQSYAEQDSTSAAGDPSPAEIVAKCAEALGGEGSWQAVKTLEISGVQASFSKQRPFLLRKMRPDLYRLDHSEGVRPMIIGYDGEEAWWQRELLVASRGNWELPAPEVYTRAYRADARFEMPCLSSQGGDAVESIGRGELDGEPFFQLNVTGGDGSVEAWYLDTADFLPVARVSTGAYWRMPMEQRTFFSDYREVDGVLVPHHIEIETGNLYRTMDVEEVKINTDIDPQVFSLPLPGGMEALQELAGHWEVKARSRENAGSPWEESEATSVITRDFKGSLLEENISYLAATAFPLDLRRMFSYDRFREVFRIAIFDNFTSHLNVLEGKLEDGQLVSSNLGTGTQWSVYKNTHHSRETVYDIAKDSFKVKRETSVDAGGTWVREEELSYSRAAEK